MWPTLHASTKSEKLCFFTAFHNILSGYTVHCFISYQCLTGSESLGLTSFPSGLILNSSVRILAHGICVLWQQWTNSHGLLSPVEEKGQQGHSLKRRAQGPLPWQAFIASQGTLHWGWSLFTMQGFTLGGYLLQKTKERMLLITSELKDICKCKGKSSSTGYTHPWKV